MKGVRRFFRLPMGLLPRIYLVGVIQIVLVGIALTLARDLLRNESWRNRFDDELSYFVDEWANLRDDPAALHASLDRAQQRMGMRVTLRAADGTLLGNTRPEPAPALSPEELHVSTRVTRRGPSGPFPGPGGPGRLLVVSPYPGPIQVYASVSLPPPPPPPDGDRQTAIIVGLVLACTAITSVAFARTLAGPLEKLASAARAFGAGRLDVRAGLRRKDELGLVSEAFDEMAGRITQLLRSQKELLANVSHELRTPLSRIRVALDLAAEGDAQTARELLPDITEDLSELERLVEDVLTTSRLELVTEGASGGVPPLRLERVDANALVDKAAARFRTARPKHRLEVQVDGALPSLEADPVLLRRVLDNLLDNAGKYSEVGTTVRLRARAEGDSLQVEIRDEGIGIEADDLARVGTPFFRTDRSRARTTGGVGLGLALVRRILDAHHGRLTLESQPGQGTTACVVLPGAGAVDTPDGRLAAGHLS
ncbi:HAMP domain-containing sensor histidine kinase [Corallococcus silvisoli]|uniref:HAMP domain-containing sensor histidine kinase n=1 Tax=Corallococcus silvisoli TaxID=2697031 RepID=UPI002E2AC709|nr:HAMP domain-containing sensor histidine kinase [Corallococcus silvisoli]